MNRPSASSTLRTPLFFIVSILALFCLINFTTTYINTITTPAPLLFYGMTLIILIFYFLISITIALKYLSDKRCLFLIPVACAFIGSAIMMILALHNYSKLFYCNLNDSISYKEFLRYYFYRNALTLTQIITAALVYRFRSHRLLASHNHIIITFACISLTLAIVLIVGFSSTHLYEPTIRLASNIMVYMWTLLFFTTIALTRFRNIFWTGIYFYCFVYILTFSFLTTADVASENTWYKARLFETLGTLIFIIIIFLNAFKLYQLSNNKYENAYQNSIRDYLTQLYNRRYFYLALTKKMQRVSVQKPLSILLCDIDHFKRINDKYGHFQGDLVIQYVAWVLQDQVRRDDIVARTGGEEFALLLPDVGQQQAQLIAERIRQAIISPGDVSSRVKLHESVTISIGLATTEDPKTVETELLNRADDALYQAKKAGRNCVVAWQKSSCTR
ncbi:sensor domain-containing diguanylate cyclase [Klebsiella quasipneumoniae]|uniref:sensor domain-containing diguanylate cyclase n=1 Tax=Klebsiella quasipneumoniae TaxID=1463165 RepID=UPI001F564F22|nr:sensor domain-containing diguanylate cyclase [Klebsiella quasipneumoniae]MCI2969082.1 GGDEF domain-containing protein [Klebsiella quasipneumoniae]HCI4229856.1 GGDEF domain-containing protein [Klebsiella quasipneumoniae subsp. similipneumoniae]HCM5202708.1 GGDEF domain-containing protein [Klebsiella quasipneumoniae subsp. similipneumoniae]